MDSDISKTLPPPPSISSNEKQTEDESTTIKSGDHDRGWNDPPVFAVEANIGGRPVPTKLNKRVAFPLSSSPIATSEISDKNSFTSIPPPIPISVPVASRHQKVFTPSPVGSVSPPSHQNTFANYTPTSGNNSSGELKFTKENVMAILSVTFESIILEPKVKEEVKKRLDIFESSWESLNEEIRMKVGKLTKCLEEKNYKSAESLLRCLGSEFISQTGPWIMAFKNIIRAKQEQP